MCNSKSWMLQALDIVLRVLQMCCVTRLFFRSLCCLGWSLVPPWPSQTVFPSASEVDEPWPKRFHPRPNAKHRNTLSVRGTSDGVAFACRARETEAQNAEPFCYNAGFKKKTQDFRIAHLCSLGRPLNWSHLQSCKSFHHISSLFIACSQTKKNTPDDSSLQRKTNQLTTDAYRPRTW